MSAAIEQCALRVLAPLDRLRALWLRLLGPLAPRLLRIRSERIALQGALLTSLSLVLALRAPLLLLTLGPIILGVPHLVSDVRYLVVRQGFLRRTAFSAAVAPCLLGTLLAPGKPWGIAAILCAVLLARAALSRRLLAASGCIAFWACSRSFGANADVILAHAHNFVALAVWAAWARGPRLHMLPSLVLCCLGCVFIWSGMADDLVLQRSVLMPGHFSIDLGTLAATLAPARDPVWAARWTICFAFMQSVHYGVWLRSVPDEDRARPGLRTLQSSYRALALDIGPWLIAGAALAVIALGVVACFDVVAARSAYLRAALFHGPLELAVGMALWTERRAVQRAG